MKTLFFMGDSLKRLRELPDEVRHDIGYQLGRVQDGLQPLDFKPMPTIGKGVEELRVFDDSGTYRVIYYARLASGVFVLHVFQKKSQATSARDVALAKNRYGKVSQEPR